MLYNDARTGAEVAWLAERIDRDAFSAATGQPLSQQLVAPKLLWISRHEPHVYRAIHRVMGAYDYVRLRLTGEQALEQNWALESGLWDARCRAWYHPVLDATGVPETWLAEVRTPHEVVGSVARYAAGATGLRAGTPVVAGSADHVAAALAAGAGPGELVLKIGGGGDVLYRVDRFAPDPRLYIDYHDIPGAFLLNGCMATSGSLVKWLAATCARDLGGDVYGQLNAEAQATPPGSDGVVILPYFLGEKTPIFDADARGVIFGLSLHHGRGHLHRAALEAVAYGFRHHAEVLAGGGHPIRSIRVMDGGARSALWRQIIADVLGAPIAYSPRGTLGSAWGVARVAGVAAGWWGWEMERLPDGDEVVHEPAPERADRYDALYRLYRDLYAHLKGDFQTARPLGS
jgi:xylulokinase